MIVSAALLAAPAARAQPVPGAHPDRRPFQSEFVLAETLAGAFMGFGLGWGMARLGADVLGPHGGEDPGLAGALFGFAVGLTVGTSLGVHLAARGYGFPASYIEALGGALAGVLLLPALPAVNEPLAVIGIFVVPAALSAIASSLGSTSRVRPVAGPDAGGVRLGVAVEF